jgi:hypothetical protein
MHYHLRHYRSLWLLLFHQPEGTRLRKIHHRWDEMTHHVINAVVPAGPNEPNLERTPQVFLKDW